MAKNDRFEIIHQEGNGLTKPTLQVIMDSVTGVQYLAWSLGNAGGLCPLVDKEGGPLTWET